MTKEQETAKTDYEVLAMVSAELTPLLSGCPNCDYDEAEGDLFRHCDLCQESITCRAYCVVSAVNKHLSMRRTFTGPGQHL